MAIRYWLVVQPLDRARELVELGVVQVPWGVREPLERMRQADGVVLYSPRETNPDGEPLRAAVQAGRVLTDAPLQQGGYARAPWRHEVEWLPEARIAPIRPLRDLLDLTRDDRWWGERLRDGFVELTRRDFEILEDAVRRPAPDPSGYMLRTLRETGYPGRMPDEPRDDRPRLIR
ncbi:MAG: EVE domain-containing protein [Microbacteriaceae bacterium]|nr:EVE domain-containing protein [Microbacteriaceae bacterium]